MEYVPRIKTSKWWQPHTTESLLCRKNLDYLCGKINWVLRPILIYDSFAVKQPCRGLMILFFSLPMLSSKVATPIWWFNTSCFESFLIYCLQCIVQCGLLQKWSFKGSLFSEGILTLVPLPKKGVKSRPWVKSLNR